MKNMIPVLNKELYDMKEMCDLLSVSRATGNNWLKLGKIVPSEKIEEKPYFTKKDVENIFSFLSNKDNTILKSRRNKKYISGIGIYREYIEKNSENMEAVENVIGLVQERSMPDGFVEAILADCALQLMEQTGKITWKEADPNELSQSAYGELYKNMEAVAGSSSYLAAYWKNELDLGMYKGLFTDLLGEIDIGKMLVGLGEILFVEYKYIPREDLLGLLYISLQNIRNRKANGAYYTPSILVKKMVKNLKKADCIGGEKEVLDPCCGTGNFLMQLSEYTDTIDHIYGNDTDAVSVKLLRINIVLEYDVQDMEQLYLHFLVRDYLLEEDRGQYDCILGNPPWGFLFKKEDELFLKDHFLTAHGKKMESYDLFLEQAMKQLKPNGNVCFVLPEAILNVAAHRDIREIIRASHSVRYVSYLGNAFDKVQCPAILMRIENTGSEMTTNALLVEMQEESFEMKENREITSEYFNFHISDTDYHILERMDKLPGHITLSHNAEFALGIVTGDNKRYLSTEKTEKNEPVLKGADIGKFSIKEIKNYLEFLPQGFQQMAPETIYRAEEKLFYRFISNQLVFAYDKQQHLSLNSCNIVIPHVAGLDIKYCMAVLNSRAAQFYFDKTFHSIKVLRSHIEQIPIPMATEEVQKNIINMVDDILELHRKELIYRTYDKMDQAIMNLYGFTEKEQERICQSVADPKKVLG